MLVFLIGAQYNVQNLFVQVIMNMKFCIREGTLIERICYDLICVNLLHQLNQRALSKLVF